MIRKKQKKFTNNYIIILISFGIVLLLSLFLTKKYIQHNKEKENKNYISKCDHVRFANEPIVPSNKLKDPNELQLIHAQKNGLKKPFLTDQEFISNLDSLKRNSILLEVTDNRFYQLKSLTHSQPYLIPQAVDMLNEIGYRFQERLKEKKYNNYRFRITSLLRTEEAQKSLHHHNGNAIDRSTHVYGTTVDISYKNFYNTKKDTIESSYEAVQTLTKVLLEMRRECKLLAVREHKQSCFHITVVVCGPESSKKEYSIIN
jgi:hypothetical protein